MCANVFDRYLEFVGCSQGMENFDFRCTVNAMGSSHKPNTVQEERRPSIVVGFHHPYCSVKNFIFIPLLPQNPNFFMSYDAKIV